MPVLSITRVFDKGRRHAPIFVLLASTLLLSTIPFGLIRAHLGQDWQGILPSFTDETIYEVHVHTIAEGHFSDGNPYFKEYADGPPLVLFGGGWLNALPLLAGLPFNVGLYFNFVLWGLLFVLALYALFRELGAPKYVAVCGALLVYVQCFAHVWRPVNLQPVYPFMVLVYLAMARLLKERSNFNIALLALSAASTFYLFSYLWQAVVFMLGLLCLYALLSRDVPLTKAAFTAAIVGGLLGAPSVLYTFYMLHTSPYFWESVIRLGYAHTHIPMGEVIYSGGWVGVVLLLAWLINWRVPQARQDQSFVRLCIFLTVTGLGLWIEQGSNLFTGQQLETGEHVRELILPWVAVASIVLAVYVYKLRHILRGVMRIVCVGLVTIVLGASAYYTYYYFAPFLPNSGRVAVWHGEEHYSGVLKYLQSHATSSVVWSDSELSTYVSLYTSNFVLYQQAAEWELVSQKELNERYLVSRYFDNPTRDDLVTNMQDFVGRQYLHWPTTIDREIKVCKILFFWQPGHDCGTPKSAVELLGEQYFDQLIAQFSNDIKLHIQDYLRKYHVTYVVKNKVTDARWHPERLGGKLVWEDGDYSIYYLQP